MSNQRSLPDGFMTVSQALAAHPDISRMVLNRWISHGLPITKAGKGIIIHRDDLDAWMSTKVRKVTRWEFIDKAS